MSIFNGPVRGAAAFVLGMNLVAFLMKLNGSAQAGNFAWDFASAIVKVELWLAAFAISAVFLLAVVKLFQSTDDSEVPGQTPSLLETANTFKQHDENIEIASLDIAPSKKLNIPSAQIKHQEATAPPPQAPKELSKEEIRKRVLRELTGRNDI